MQITQIMIQIWIHFLSKESFQGLNKAVIKKLSKCQFYLLYFVFLGHLTIISNWVKNEFVIIYQTVKGDSWSELHNLERDSLTQACSKKTWHRWKFGISWQRNLQWYKWYWRGCAPPNYIIPCSCPTRAGRISASQFCLLLAEWSGKLVHFIRRLIKNYFKCLKP